MITRYVDYAFPYRTLIAGGSFGARRDQMLDAFAGLLVELHLAGCFWGDCSLSNVLYRYDAGAIETVMVDAETTQLFESISDGRRREDLEIMRENLAGGMADIAAAAGQDLDHADLDLGSDIAERYDLLWQELNRDLVIGSLEEFTARIAELRPTFDPVQGYADFLNYRHRRATEAGRDVDSQATFVAWIEAGMPGFEPVP